MLQHLVKGHLLGDGTTDDQVILRLGEGNGIRELLIRSQAVIRAAEELTQGLRTAKQTGNLTAMDKYRRNLIAEAVDFAIYLEQHPVIDSQAEVPSGD